MTRPKKRIFQDFILIGLSIISAILMKWSGATSYIVSHLHEWEYIGNFFAGMLFTSAFTTAPSITILGELAQHHSLLSVVFLGALGALVGDLLLFRFIRDRIGEDISYHLKHSKVKRLPAIMRTRLFHWFVPFLGAMIIASPLPDELGLTLLGLSKVHYVTFIPISFALNALGITIIALLATSF